MTNNEAQGEQTRDRRVEAEVHICITEHTKFKAPRLYSRCLHSIHRAKVRWFTLLTFLPQLNSNQRPDCLWHRSVEVKAYPFVPEYGVQACPKTNPRVSKA